MRTCVALGALLSAGMLACDDARVVQKFADRTCECKDKDCARIAIDDFVAWANEHKDARGDQKKADDAMRQMIACAQKLGVSLQDLSAAPGRMTE